MTIIIEFERPFIWKPGKFKSRIMTRICWGFIAISKLNIDFQEFVKRLYIKVEE